ncbi:hypothetical protein M8C21_004905 [Ambrosia artemisiifolia]|uniref:Nascent polypeptide-associated complex subunit beta n=1 Tax=Ambrosia artemisiifolia TaxID=4212 RepID=A0AAD5CVS5_AMBAR|nr:hypothetical protein M8C21_004905 [Ambrosia artemisiifolia]
MHNSTKDDKELQSTLQRIGVLTLPTMEEVNIFTDDKVIQILNPKVEASIQANTWVVSGTPQVKNFHDALAGVFTMLGPDHLAHLKQLAEQFQKQKSGTNPATTQADDDEGLKS